MSFNYIIRQNDSYIELYIDRGKESQEENLSIFSMLKASQEKIEETFEGNLNWDPMEGRRACRVANYYEAGGYRSPEEEWKTVYDPMIEDMIKLEAALRPYIERLEI